MRITAGVDGNYDWAYVRIDTDSAGLSGPGEFYTMPGMTASCATSRRCS